VRLHPNAKTTPFTRELLVDRVQRLTYRDDVDLEKKLAVWKRFHNYDRPHGAHRGKTP